MSADPGSVRVAAGGFDVHAPEHCAGGDRRAAGRVPAHCFTGHQGDHGGDLPDSGGPSAHGRGGARGLRLSWWTAPSSPAWTGATAAICGRSSTSARG